MTLYLLGSPQGASVRPKDTDRAPSGSPVQSRFRESSCLSRWVVVRSWSRVAVVCFLGFGPRFGPARYRCVFVQQYNKRSGERTFL